MVTHFVATGPSSVAMDAAFAVTVRAVDALGNVATAYRSTVKFGSAGKHADLADAYTLMAADSGVHTFTGLALRKKGAQTVRVSDAGTAATLGSLDAAARGPCPRVARSPDGRLRASARPPGSGPTAARRRAGRRAKPAGRVALSFPVCHGRPGRAGPLTRPGRPWHTGNAHQPRPRAEAMTAKDKGLSQIPGRAFPRARQGLVKRCRANDRSGKPRHCAAQKHDAGGVTSACFQTASNARRAAAASAALPWASRLAASPNSDQPLSGHCVRSAR